ncbi:serine hydrolase domain-containing protein [Actinoplanes sp. CA-030573]|uniref:serine hydrolase domain-containing protein n=1 Tax=Actinoplanes sp. CA-030573 TaxID=3239898 RepID=UPI003D89EB08
MTTGNELQELLHDAIRAHDVPGAAVAVGHDGKLTEAAAGVLNRDTGVRATPDSLFQIGSVTKVWTAALVLQLVDEGRVDLDEPVRRYLPEFAVADQEATETVTVRNLLTHTAGFEGDLFEDTGRGDDALERYLAYLAEAAGQVHPVGALYSYSNSGFAVAGALVARLRGTLWETALRDRLITPLGVTHMALLPEEAILFRASAGHDHRGDIYREWLLPRSLGPAGSAPSAAPRELVRFGRALLSPKNGPISADAVAAMTTAQVSIPGVPGRTADRYGLGIALFDWNGTPVIGHDGGTIGQSTLWRVVPGHDLVVAMTANGGEADAVFDTLLDRIIKDATGVTVPPRPAPSGTPAGPGPERFAGSYAYGLNRYDVAVADEGLDVTVTAQGVAAENGVPPATMRCVPLTGDTFVTSEPFEGAYRTITFVGDGRFLHDGRAAPRLA